MSTDRTLLGLSLAHSLVQPRVGRRIAQISEIIDRQIVFGYERKLYASAFQVDPERVTVVSLGDAGKGVSAIRVARLLRGFASIAHVMISGHPAMVYCFSIDLGIVGLLAKIVGARLCYEISDLHFSTKHTGFFNRVGIFAENVVLRSADIVVTTSPYFDEDIRLRVPRVLNRRSVIENGLPEEFMRKVPRTREVVLSPLRGRPIRLGVIGAFKYVDVLIAFLEVVKEFPMRYVCAIYGDGFWRKQISDICTGSVNLILNGPYRNPEDLETVYHDVDLVVALYDATDPNVRLALPNKLYESVYFAKPLIVTAETALARRVLEWGVGYAIDSSSRTLVRRFLEDLKLEDIGEKAVQCGQIPNAKLASNPRGFLHKLGESLTGLHLSEIV